MIIALDMDSVIANIIPDLFAFHNKKYGTTFRVEEHTDYDLTKLLKCDKDEVVRRVFEFYFSPQFDEIKPMPDSQEAIDYLNKHHELHVITSRPLETASQTKRWISKYFPIQLDNIHFTGQFSNQANTITKSHFCKTVQARIMIEDALEYAFDCATCDLDVLLLDMPWNQYSDLPSNMYRMKSWNEITKYVDSKN